MSLSVMKLQASTNYPERTKSPLAVSALIKKSLATVHEGAPRTLGVKARATVIKKLILCSLFGLHVIAASASDTLSYTATYNVSYGQLPVGEVSRHFDMKDQKYNFTLTSKVLVPLYHYKLVQKSSGNWPSSSPSGRCFSEQMNEQVSSFCFTNKTFDSLHDKNKVLDKSKIYDELNYQLAMQEDIASGKSKLSYWILRKQKLKNYIFQLIGPEVIDTPIGKMATMKLVRIHSHKPTTTTFWLSSKHNYLPIAVEQVRPNRSKVKVMISNLTWQDKLISASKP